MKCSKLRATSWRRNVCGGPKLAPDAWSWADIWSSLKVKQKTSSSLVWVKVSGSRVNWHSETGWTGWLLYLVFSMCFLRVSITTSAVQWTWIDLPKQAVPWFVNFQVETWVTYGWTLLTLRRKVHSDGRRRTKWWRTWTGTPASPTIQAPKTVPSYTYPPGGGMICHVKYLVV